MPGQHGTGPVVGELLDGVAFRRRRSALGVKLLARKIDGAKIVAN